MVDLSRSRIVFAPRLGWHDVALRDLLARETGLPVHMENSGRACALAQVWDTRGEGSATGDLVFVSVSDGLGVGIVVNGEVMRGRHNVGGEFGHVPLNTDGPPCACGASGCWEAYVSNLATLSRYFGRELSPRKPIPAEIASFTVDDLIARARGGDGKAVAALQATAHYLGLGLASVVNAVDPSRIFVSGEIIAAWDLLESTVRQALAQRRAGGRVAAHRDHAAVGARSPAPARRRRARHRAAVRRAEGWVVSCTLRTTNDELRPIDGTGHERVDGQRDAHERAMGQRPSRCSAVHRSPLSVFVVRSS